MDPDPRPDVRLAPNTRVFDLPVIVGIEEGLFEKAGLDVSFSATYADRERDDAEKPVLSRLKEQMFECGSADSYNVCEWASIDRLERGKRGGSIAALRAAVAAQGILTFDEKLQTPRELLRAFVHYKHVDYYDPALFNRAYDWMKARGMTEGQSEHAALVVG